MCQICELPVKTPFVVGLYSGTSKPSDLWQYLNDFIVEMNSLEREGLCFTNVNYQVKISAFVCDPPARAFLKNIKPHNGFNGCERCVQKGKFDTKMSFPEINAAARNEQLRNIDRKLMVISNDRQLQATVNLEDLPFALPVRSMDEFRQVENSLSDPGTALNLVSTVVLIHTQRTI